MTHLGDAPLEPGLLCSAPSPQAVSAVPASIPIAWRPLDTAPKDGTVVQLTALEPNGEPFEIWPMQWGHIQTNGLFPGKVGMWMTPDGSITWNGTEDEGGPTHWHPLAAPRSP